MTFYETVTAAIRDITEHGYDSEHRVQFWTEQIRAAALASLTPPEVLEKALRDTLTAAYRRNVEQGAILRHHPGISRFTLERIKPKLRPELDRRIMASANLIKLSRQASIEKTLQRFAGWSTSVPIGGSDAVEKSAVKSDIRKALVSLPYAERRVAIDQGHKLLASINEIVSVEAGALAGRWRSRWRQAGYNYREDHKERDEHVYAVRGNWALAKGLMKAGPDGYTDDITKPGEEINCRCFMVFIYALRDLPADMLTAKGKTALGATQAEIRASTARTDSAAPAPRPVVGYEAHRIRLARLTGAA